MCERVFQGFHHRRFPRHSRAQAAMEMRWSLVQLEGNAREIVRFLQRKETCLKETRLKETRLRLSSAELLHRPLSSAELLHRPYPHPAESVDEFSFYPRGRSFLSPLW